MNAHNVAELVQTLFEESGDALFLFDTENERIVDVNPMCERLSGFGCRDLLDQPVTYLFRSEAQGGLQRLRQAFKSTGLFHSQEGFFLRQQQQGMWLPVNLTITRLHAKPKTLGLITARDIRERRQTEAQLRKAETDLRRVLASVSDCLWTAERNGSGRWTECMYSPVVEKLTGKPPSFFLADMAKWLAIVHPEDQARWQEFVSLTQVGDCMELEYRIAGREGAVRWVRESITISCDGDSTHLRLHGVVADITKRKEVEEDLRGQRTLLRNILANIPHSVFWKDRQGIYLGCNDNSARDLGMSSAQHVIGKSDYDMCFTRAEADFYVKCDLEVMEGDKPLLNIEETQLRPDGKQATLLTSKVPLRDGEGQVVGVLGIYADITEHKRLEDQLRQSQKMEAVGRLAGGVAHDFNNLLTVITGYTELLLSELLPEDPWFAKIREIKFAADRAAGLTRQLLAFSRKQVLAPKALDLNALVTETQSMLRRLIGEDIELVSRLQPNLWQIHADPGQIHQVLLNLAVNARDAMPQGGRLTIATANARLEKPLPMGFLEAPPGPYVELSVSDTGSGMKQETLAHLFEPFYTTKEVGKGTGLGLATVYGIVKQSGGDILVRSEPGKGSSFSIYLPAAETAVPLSSERRLSEVRKGLETILVVEDEAGVRSLTKCLLEMDGYQVLEAANGAEAILLCERFPDVIHLMATDVVMPQMSGRQLSDRLAPLRPDMKVLYISGYTEDAIVHHGVLDNGFAFLNKPFSKDGLSRKVREVLDTGASVH
ncbi:MAG: PAS domain S-box protein [Planctomycetes bacterium]|nr:PAS domain S-box protein [Planctomycetota bacterium]